MKQFAALLLLLVVSTFASQARAGDTFKIDPVHSSVIFRIGHANVGIIYGRFNDAAGDFTIDKDDATKNTFNIQLNVNNVDTHQEKRDAHLKSPDFFNAKQYPKITFKSTAVAKGEGKMLEVTGDLTIHGVTKSVKIPVEIIGQGDFGGTLRTGVETVFSIKRSDFDMKGLAGAVGDDVKLMIAIEGGKLGFMLTGIEILLAVIVPMASAALLATIGAWRKWVWAMPLAAGLGFIISYASILAYNHFSIPHAPGEVVSWRFWPKIPPSDGTDWIFWLAMPLVALAVIDALVGKGWGWLLAGFAGVMAVVMLKPLMHTPPLPDEVTPAMQWTMAAVAGVASIVLALVAGFAEKRIGSLWVVMSFCVVTGGAGVVIFSSNLRTSGLYGIAAAAALGPVAVLGTKMMGARSVAVFAAPLLAGLLVVGRFYPDPGVSWVNFRVLLGAPVLIMIGALLPMKRQWMRGAIALLAVTIAVAAVTGPTALAAKKAADTQPVGDLYK